MYPLEKVISDCCCFANVGKEPNQVCKLQVEKKLRQAHWQTEQLFFLFDNKVQHSPVL